MNISLPSFDTLPRPSVIGRVVVTGSSHGTATTTIAATDTNASSSIMSTAPAVTAMQQESGEGRIGNNASAIATTSVSSLLRSIMREVSTQNGESIIQSDQSVITTSSSLIVHRANRTYTFGGSNDGDNVKTVSRNTMIMLQPIYNRNFVKYVNGVQQNVASLDKSLRQHRIIDHVHSVSVGTAKTNVSLPVQPPRQYVCVKKLDTVKVRQGVSAIVVTSAETIATRVLSIPSTAWGKLLRCPKKQLEGFVLSLDNVNMSTTSCRGFDRPARVDDNVAGAAEMPTMPKIEELREDDDGGNETTMTTTTVRDAKVVKALSVVTPQLGHMQMTMSTRTTPIVCVSSMPPPSSNDVAASMRTQHDYAKKSETKQASYDNDQWMVEAAATKQEDDEKLVNSVRIRLNGIALEGDNGDRNDGGANYRRVGRDAAITDGTVTPVAAPVTTVIATAKKLMFDNNEKKVVGYAAEEQKWLADEADETHTREHVQTPPSKHNRPSDELLCMAPRRKKIASRKFVEKNTVSTSTGRPIIASASDPAVGITTNVVATISDSMTANTDCNPTMPKLPLRRRRGREVSPVNLTPRQVVEPRYNLRKRMPTYNNNNNNNCNCYRGRAIVAAKMKSATEEGCGGGGGSGLSQDCLILSATFDSATATIDTPVNATTVVDTIIAIPPATVSIDHRNNAAGQVKDLVVVVEEVDKEKEKVDDSGSNDDGDEDEDSRMQQRGFLNQLNLVPRQSETMPTLLQLNDGEVGMANDAAVEKESVGNEEAAGNDDDDNKIRDGFECTQDVRSRQEHPSYQNLFTLYDQLTIRLLQAASCTTDSTLSSSDSLYNSRSRLTMATTGNEPNSHRALSREEYDSTVDTMVQLRHELVCRVQEELHTAEELERTRDLLERKKRSISRLRARVSTLEKRLRQRRCTQNRRIDRTLNREHNVYLSNVRRIALARQQQQQLGPA